MDLRLGFEIAVRVTGYSLPGRRLCVPSAAKRSCTSRSLIERTNLRTESGQRGTCSVSSSTYTLEARSPQCLSRLSEAAGSCSSHELAGTCLSNAESLEYVRLGNEP